MPHPTPVVAEISRSLPTVSRTFTSGAIDPLMSL
jgi:hypothetical protein